MIIRTEGETVNVRESRTYMYTYSLWRRIKRSGWGSTDVTKEVGEFARRGKVAGSVYF
jgi:hypothetical protein